MCNRVKKRTYDAKIVLVVRDLALRRGARGYDITSLPYKVKVYINNQVLIPAKLVRSLGITNWKYADIVIRYGNNTIVIKNAKLLRTRHTDSRQFTIPKEIREKYGIKPGDEIEVLEIRKPSESSAEQ